MATEAGGTAALLRLVQSSSIRDKSCHEALRLALLSLANLCRYQENACSVFEHDGLLMLLADLLQLSRDKEVLGLGHDVAEMGMHLGIRPGPASLCPTGSSKTCLQAVLNEDLYAFEALSCASCLLGACGIGYADPH